MNDVKKMKHLFIETLNEEIYKRVVYYDERTERWQLSDRGNAYLLKTDELTEIRDAVENFDI